MKRHDASIANQHPLVTFLLVAYNQEKYVREAVAGAFAQDYEPLEIVLSDDASRDNTFEIMQSMAAEYTGPHRLILNQNSHNLGVCRHLTKCGELANGAVIVGAAGDDVSLPNRVTEIVRVWQTADSRFLSVFSNSEIIDDVGDAQGLWFKQPPEYTRSLSEFKKNRRSWVTGCSHAFSKELLTCYEQLDSRILQEDGALSFRALLRGQILYIDKVLVKYRRHDGNTYSTKDTARILRLKKHEYFLKCGWLRDAQSNKCQDEQLLSVIRRACREALLTRIFYSIPVLGSVALSTRRSMGKLWRRRHILLGGLRSFGVGA